MSTISRRTILAGAASVPALAVPASASTTGPDPIFALIDQWRAILDVLTRAIQLHSDLEASVPEDRRSWYSSHGENKPPEGCTDDPDWLAAEIALGKGYDEHRAALCALMTVSPTTINGFAALFDLMAKPQWSERGEYPGEDPLLYELTNFTDETIVQLAYDFPLRIADGLRALDTLAAKAVRA